ncbi:gamma carbonic anhydrase family protein [Thalassospira sp. MCCC 1A01428]|uniref:gamma carbonic anhydrase family protein n=1 Tax=Thalassospira sp. MCCC 1A01428 TaxID=1470575 RepID=UPI000A1EB1E0|nr:gamma carbonic anhydrase family protein [Thalassospira sp. MCCC 1A01428]OSQ42025.1 carbonic anhydrase [Thalassospira sp. MCCC 1A01428]
MPTILKYRDAVPQIADTAFIAPNATLIGDVEIGPETGIWFGCVIRGDVHEIRIGARTNIQDLTMVHVAKGKFGTYIGDDVTIGHSAVIHACTLEDRSFVGMGATVMDGCVIEQGAMLGAGALLSPGKRIPAGELWAGVPARKVRELTQEEIEFFKVSADRYAGLAEEYRVGIASGDAIDSLPDTED